MSPPLQPPDSFHLSAATGWLELGNPSEAMAELENLSPAAQSHPEVLETRWQAAAAAKQWETALEIASRLIRADPNQPQGWIHRSYSLHELKRTREAWDNLLQVAQRFQDNVTIPYNLACYACQMGHHDYARRWLSQALKTARKTGRQKQVRSMAEQDPDLKPLWIHSQDDYGLA